MFSIIILAIPIYFILIFFLRIVLEFVIVVFKIAEDTKKDEITIGLESNPLSEEKGLFKSVFDTKFEVFLTPQLIKIIYKIVLFGLPIAFLVGTIALVKMVG